jgi:hypothetical protein
MWWQSGEGGDRHCQRQTKDYWGGKQQGCGKEGTTRGLLIDSVSLLETEGGNGQTNHVRVINVQSPRAKRWNAEAGTYAEILERKGLYHELFELQFGGLAPRHHPSVSHVLDAPLRKRAR